MVDLMVLDMLAMENVIMILVIIKEILKMLCWDL